MNKTDEELNLAEAMAKRYGVRMCDENGDTHGEELYCVGIDDIADIIREARAEQDHIAASGKMIAEPLQILPGGGAFPFVEVGYVGEFVAPSESLPAGTPLCAAPTQPVKQEPVAKYQGMGGEYAYHILKLYEDIPEGTLLYAAPVDAKAIRAEAYQQGRNDMKEEAAKMFDCDDYRSLAAAIRSLK